MGATTPTTASAPRYSYPERRGQRLKCVRCSSTDVSRMPDEKGIYADIMRILQRKPFLCFKCGYRFYFHARRKQD